VPRRPAAFSVFGGINTYDQEETLVQKSISMEGGGVRQTAPLETNDMQNMDFDQQGIRQRSGSTFRDTVPAGITGSTSFEPLATGQTWVVVTTVSGIYVKQDNVASWTKLTQADGSAFSENIVRSTFVNLDGRLFIGIQTAAGTAHIQVYRYGSKLDDPLATTYTGTWAVARRLYSVKDKDLTTAPSTPGTGDRYIVAGLGGGWAAAIVGDVAEWDGAAWGFTTPTVDDVTYVIDESLGYTWSGSAWGITAVYVDSLFLPASKPNQTLCSPILGVWEPNTYLIAALHERLVYSTGNNLLEYTATADVGIWDRSGVTAGFQAFGGAIRMMTSFVPYFGDQINEILYVGTATEMVVLTGFLSTDRVVKIGGAAAPYSYRAHAHTEKWLVYLSANKRVLGISGTTIVDLGRRLSSPTGDGPFDEMASRDDGNPYAHAVYHPVKKQFMLWYATTTGIGTAPRSAAVIDFALGEPIVGESQAQLEQHVRVLHWSTGVNWYKSVVYVPFQAEATTLLGMDSSGDVFDIGTGVDDFVNGVNLTVEAIEAHWDFPRFDAGAFSRHKQWYRTLARFLMRDTSGSPTDTITAEFYYNGTMVVGATDTRTLPNTSVSHKLLVYDEFAHADSLRVRIKNYTLNETFTMASFQQEFDILAEVVE
jgi:hypothetical protein